MANPIRELLRRRVPQFLGLYLGGSWGVVQFVDWLVKRYLLPNALTDGVLLALASLAPAMILLAWGHGAPGRDPWGRTERIGVPVNLVLTLALLGTFLHGRDLGATAQRVTVTDEEGQAIERLVPKQDHRRELFLFFWENESDDESLDWLRYGMPRLLEQDLEQDPYLVISTPLGGWEKSYFLRLQRAGFGDGLGAPVALQRRMAEDYGFGYFGDGALGRSEEGFELRLDLYRVEPAVTVAELRTVGPELLPLIDQMTELLKSALEIPSGSEQLADNLPVADHLSHSLEALKAFVGAQTSILLSNDRERALELLEAAVEHDPSFALAQSAQSQILNELGMSEKALVAARAALRNDYKLPERDRFHLKAGSYWIEGQTDKAVAVYEMWTELYPDDTQALATLANQYQWNGNRIDDAIATFERLLEVDPSQDWVLNRLADMWLVKGDSERARTYYERYTELHPDQSGSWSRLARWHIRQGELETARELYEKTELMSSDSISPLINLADVDLRQGDLEAVEALLAQAGQAAGDDRSQATVCSARLELLHFRGRMAEWAELSAEWEELQSRYRSPANLVVETLIIEADHWVEAGREEETWTRLEELEEQLESPYDRFVVFGKMLFFLAEGDAGKAEVALRAFETFIEDYDRPDLISFSGKARGDLALLRRQATEAVEHYRQALAAHDSSAQAAYSNAARRDLLVGLGRSYRLAGEGEEAVERLEEVLKTFPSHPWAHLELALLAEAEGRLETARDHLDRVMVLWEGADEAYPPAREARALAGRLARRGMRASG